MIFATVKTPDNFKEVREYLLSDLGSSQRLTPSELISLIVIDNKKEFKKEFKKIMKKYDANNRTNSKRKRKNVHESP